MHIFVCGEAPVKIIYQRGSPGKVSASPLSFKLLRKLSCVLYPGEKKPIPVKIVRFKSPVKILKSSGALYRDVIMLNQCLQIPGYTHFYRFRCEKLPTHIVLTSPYAPPPLFYKSNLTLWSARNVAYFYTILTLVVA